LTDFSFFLGLNGGWSLGALGCHANSALIIYTLGCSLLSVFFISLTRYLSLIRNVQFTPRHIDLMIAGIWIAMMVIVGAFLVLLNINKDESYTGLAPTYTYCMIAGYTKKGFAPALLVLLVIVGIMIFQIYAWTTIVLYYMRTNRSRMAESVISSSSPAAIPESKVKKIGRKSQLSLLEIRLIKKAIGITLTFVLTWIWYVAYLIVELASKQAVPLWVSNDGFFIRVKLMI
jgi:hypothetical protein